MILLVKKLSIVNILTTINFHVHDLDLQAMGGDGDGTEKNFDPYLSSDHIHPRVWK